jgi:hypothetical protein
MTVERSDLEAKLREIQGAISETSQGATSPGVLAAIAGVGLLVVAYVMGRRRGKKGAARVEVYRVR